MMKFHLSLKTVISLSVMCATWMRLLLLLTFLARSLIKKEKSRLTSEQQLLKNPELPQDRAAPLQVKWFPPLSSLKVKQKER